MANFSTLEALKTLCTSIPNWNTRLDELNSQIALRQIELARLSADNDRPPTQSIKNKGSTESLRPKDNSENPFSVEKSEDINEFGTNPFDTPKSTNGFTRSDSAAARAAVTSSPKISPNAGPSPGPLARNTSQSPAQGRTSPAVLRKRKTDSLASGESIAPKYRTRSMIIVWYDSAVQTAFEELVTFVSGSRNSMRKGKMAAKMAEMKRAAELEMGDDDDEDEDETDEVDDFNNGNPGSGNLLIAAQPSKIKQSENLKAGLEAGPEAGLEPAIIPEPQLPKLKFTSTRQMGPSRGGPVKGNNYGASLNVGMLRGYRRAGGEAPDIFDELDKGLEWCQGQCGHAAHQFLRDGDCSTEIENIKKRLMEVRDTAEKEVERLKKEEAELPKPEPKPANTKRSLQMKAPNIRKDTSVSNSLEVDDDMEIDDEGVDDLQIPTKLIFKRSRDI
ncbi:hypothetical protein VTL71DRAFT_979 [Oculimacula yallundae]|uniref:Uncharacterized protein n=1 Tax=Oculimacula yallundae TaxID=86028 RepID=A0ABR4D3V2_9HELO